MRSLDTKQYLDETVKLLENGAKELPVPVSGFSMAPFLSDGDTVILSLPGKIGRGDVVLYLRCGERYVLHRVKRVKNGIYTVLGDAQSICEDGITEGDIKAVAVGAIHRGKKCLPGSFRWFFYKTFWLSAVPLRRTAFRVYGVVRKK